MRPFDVRRWQSGYLEVVTLDGSFATDALKFRMYSAATCGEDAAFAVVGSADVSCAQPTDAPPTATQRVATTDDLRVWARVRVFANAAAANTALLRLRWVGKVRAQ